MTLPVLCVRRSALVVEVQKSFALKALKTELLLPSLLREQSDGRGLLSAKPWAPPEYRQVNILLTRGLALRFAFVVFFFDFFAFDSFSTPFNGCRCRPAMGLAGLANC